MDKIIEFLLQSLPSLGLTVIAIPLIYRLFKDHLTTVQKVNKGLQEDFERIRKDNKELREEFSASKHTNAALDKVVKQLQQEAAEDKHQVEQLKQLVGALQSGFNRALNQVDNLALAIATISEHLQGLKSFNKNMFDDLRTELQQHDVKLVSLHDMLGQLSGQRVRADVLAQT